MADPYWRYGAAAPIPSNDIGSIAKSSFPGYLSSDPSTVTTFNPYSSSELRGASDFLHKDILPSRAEANGINNTRAEPGVSGLNAGASIRGFPSSFEDPNLLVDRRHVAPGVIPNIADISYERPSSITRSAGPLIPVQDSNILFVDGLPTDCTRREIGHLFRPFIGFRDLKVVHKEPRRHGDKAMVLCFVEFTDAKCALTAMEALQGYKFDDRKPESGLLKIHFAHFPFRLPSDRNEPRAGGLR